jgi:uncharacterized Fe-S cluster-containing MiaB family protein
MTIEETEMIEGEEISEEGGEAEAEMTQEIEDKIGTIRKKNLKTIISKVGITIGTETETERIILHRRVINPGKKNHQFVKNLEKIQVKESLLIKTNKCSKIKILITDPLSPIFKKAGKLY